MATSGLSRRAAKRRRVGRVAASVGAGLAVVLVALATAFVLSSSTRHSAAPLGTTAQPGASGVQARVALVSGAAPINVPRSFLGISTEYWTIPVWGRHPVLLKRVLAMLRVDAPLRLRIGGDSADHSFWAPQRELPAWIFELTPSWLSDVTRIARESDVRFILDLNLVTATPRSAARWAATAQKKLPKHSIVAFEIGNEPDIYNRASWQKMTAGGGAGSLPTKVTATTYASDFASYARALMRAAPGVPLLAPALANPQKNAYWVSRLLSAAHPGLRGVTAHRYPYSACARPGSSSYPTIARVLSDQATAGMARTALKVEKISDRARLPLWLTEINSVTCGGTPGISDTFATALWAPDALFELVRAGVESASVHVRAAAINMAFSLTAGGLVAHPLLYGMALFARTLGPGARLVPVRVSAPRSLNLKAWTVLVRGRVFHVLLIDKSRHRARVWINLPAAGTGTVQRLIAPSVSSRSGVTLAGQSLNSQALWQGTRRSETVSRGPGGYLVALPPFSAALVTLKQRP
jgi:Glycosyl hydrolase family 79 C-terminal beta domain